MNELALAGVFVLSLLAFQNWRQAFVLCVVAALLQDPLRKMVPGQPVYFVVLVGIVFGAGFLGALMRNVPLSPNRLTGWRQHLGQPFLVFCVIALFQAANSLLQYEKPVMTGIGIMSYFAPIPAVVLAYRFALSRGENGVFRWMRFYVVAATIALASVYLEYAGYGARFLGEVGGGVLISGQGAYYKGNSGTFRAAEIAAWHAAAVACFSFLLFWGRRFSFFKILLAVVFIAFLVGIGALTGRRKMIIEIAIFLSAYFTLIAWFQRKSTRIAIIVAALGVLSYFSSIGLLQPEAGEAGYASERLEAVSGNAFVKYTDRASTAFEDVPRRVMETGIQPVFWAVNGHGWLGSGLGTGSQGVQHFGIDSSGAAEGGLGKLTVELGVPGLLVAVWLAWSLLRYIVNVLEFLSQTSTAHANFGIGLVAFILANIAAFTVATQAFGDLFILLTLGWSFGFLLALPALAQASASGSGLR